MKALRDAVLAMVLAQSAAAADSARIFSRTHGGSMGTTTISAIATDSSGNVIVAGTTSSFDFPVTNSSVNSRTAIAESFDSGKTWKPLGNLPADSTYVLARDASTPPLLFAGGRTGVFRSNDGGKAWALVAGPAPLNCGNPICDLSAVTADPVRPGTVYAGGSLGIMKTTNGGASWQAAMAVNQDGTIVVAGRDSSTRFPVTSDALQPAQGGPQDAFLAKLDAAGNLFYATYLGGTTPHSPSFTGVGTSQITGATFDAGKYCGGGLDSGQFSDNRGRFPNRPPGSLPVPVLFGADGVFGNDRLYANG